MLSKRKYTGDSVRADIRRKYGFDGDLARFFANNRGLSVSKWHHYIPLYDRYFGHLRRTPVRFLEIGVAKGGSLQMWRRYFGGRAVLFGIDINPDCAALDGAHGQVRIGSQADPAFLEAVIDEMGGVDVVLDDGSHMMEHVRASLTAIYPRLAAGGVYMIEDLCTAYMAGFGGGYRGDSNFFQEVRGIIDDMHRWYHTGPVANEALAGKVSGLHVHDSMVVIEKGPVFPPVYSQVG